MTGFIEWFKIVLAVLGIISANPDVNYDNNSIFVRHDFEKNTIYLQFKAYNIINTPIRDIIESGIEVNLIYHIRTTLNDRLVYQGASVIKITFISNDYSINGGGNYDFQIFTNAISVNEMTILTNAGNFSNQLLRTDVDLLINSDEAPKIMKLWGKSHQLRINYRIEK